MSTDSAKYLTRDQILSYAQHPQMFPNPAKVALPDIESVMRQLLRMVDVGNDVVLLCADCGQPEKEHDLGGAGHRFRLSSYPIDEATYNRIVERQS